MMASAALRQWETVRAGSLDQVEQTHRAIGGTGRGQRFATLQVNHAYAVLLASQFQGFCRDLHTECVAFVVQRANPVEIHRLLEDNLRLHRKLDRRNAIRGTLGADFNRFGLLFWDQVKAHDARTLHSIEMLEALNTWRNAIAHQDFRKLGGRSVLHLRTVKTWRRACNGLARSFDSVMQAHLQRMLGASPW